MAKLCRFKNEVTYEEFLMLKIDEKNKRILGKEMPSKRIRNRLAGLISRLKKQEEKAKLETQ